jgi:adenine-specific DNA-methyltransferase
VVRDRLGSVRVGAESAEEGEECVKQMFNRKKQNSSTLTIPYEREIDQLVYKLYRLTEEEIKIVEGK